nr:immunoglobulin light chain junction region [Macaca mulatta]
DYYCIPYTSSSTWVF